MFPRFGVPRWRGSLLVGVVITVLVAGVGLAVAGDGEGPGPLSAAGSSVVDPEVTREAAVAYLMAGGVSERDAELRMSRQSGQMAVATRLRRQAPDDIRSVWIDDDGVLVASVVTDRGVALAEAAGVVPVLVTFAAAEVEAARETLIDDVTSSPPPGFGGASFEIDEGVGKVIARYFFVEGPGVVPAAATGLGDLVRATAGTGELGPNLDIAAGHLASQPGGQRYCTVGWAVDIAEGPDPGDRHQGVMTAGHCFEIGRAPEDTLLSIDTGDGETSARGVAYADFDHGDYGYLRLEGSDDNSVPAVATAVGPKFVKELADPVEGAIICKFGLRTGETCGEIERVDVSTVFEHREANILLTGMVRTSYCALHGDSGGPVYASFTDFGATDSSITALGIHSSGMTHLPLPGPTPDPSEPPSTPQCGEEFGLPNEAYFTPLSNMDTEGRFFVKISGG